jgi:hypothetical protein
LQRAEKKREFDKHGAGDVKGGIAVESEFGSSRYGIISQPDAWEAFDKARDLSLHIYDESIAEAVYKEALSFPEHAVELIQHLEDAGG